MFHESSNIASGMSQKNQNLRIFVGSSWWCSLHRRGLCSGARSAGDLGGDFPWYSMIFHDRKVRWTSFMRGFWRWPIPLSSGGFSSHVWFSTGGYCRTQRQLWSWGCGHSESRLQSNLVGLFGGRLTRKQCLCFCTIGCVLANFHSFGCMIGFY